MLAARVRSSTHPSLKQTILPQRDVKKQGTPLSALSFQWCGLLPAAQSLRASFHLAGAKKIHQCRSGSPPSSQIVLHLGLLPHARPHSYCHSEDGKIAGWPT